jgi:hypothetical protein
MRTVIGYYYKTLTADLLKSQGVDKNELIGTTIQLCFGVAVDSYTIKDIKPNNIDDIDKMVSQNIGVVKHFDTENYIAEVIFEFPMPEDVFNQYYKDEKPIYKN